MTGVVDNADKHWFVYITAIFNKIRKDPNGTLRGRGDTDLWKKLWNITVIFWKGKIIGKLWKFPFFEKKSYWKF